MCEILVNSKIAEQCCKKVVYLLNYPILEQTALRVATEQFLPNVAPFRQQHSSQQWFSVRPLDIISHNIAYSTNYKIESTSQTKNVQYSHDNELLLQILFLTHSCTHPSSLFQICKICSSHSTKISSNVTVALTSRVK